MSEHFIYPRIVETKSPLSLILCRKVIILFQAILLYICIVVDDIYFIFEPNKRILNSLH